MLFYTNIELALGTNIQQTCKQTQYEENKQDIQDFSEKCGLESIFTRTEGDARYNNATFSAIGKTPFQTATQVTNTLSENVTKQNVVTVLRGCKISKKCTHLRAKEKEVICLGHEECTAPFPQRPPMGMNSDWLRNASVSCISNFTGDGDSAAAFRPFNKQGYNIQNLKDLRHFFDSHRKQTEVRTNTYCNVHQKPLILNPYLYVNHPARHQCLLYVYGAENSIHVLHQTSKFIN